MAQNIIDIGIDIGKLSSDKEEALSIMQDLFSKLEAYDGKKFNIFGGGGLSELNSSVSVTSKLLDELNTKLSSLSSSSSSFGAASSGVKQSTDQLGLSVKEYNNQTSQAAVAVAKLAALTSDQAKETAALKLQLSETTKQILEEAKANSASGQASNYAKIQSQEYRLEQQRVVETLRSLAVEQDKQSKSVLKDNNQKRIDDEKKLSDAKKKQEQDSINAEKQLKKEQLEVKNLSNDYQILKNTLKEQSIAYANANQRFGESSPQAKEALTNYATTAAVIGDIDTKLQNAQPKAFGLGKGLSSMYNQLRIIAYVVPGIGIAGIFNKAYEAIAAAVEELDIIPKSLSEIIEHQSKVNDQYNTWLDLLNKIIDAQDTTLGKNQALENNVKDLVAQGKSRLDQLRAEQQLLNNTFFTANDKFTSEGGFDKQEKAANRVSNIRKLLQKEQDEYDTYRETKSRGPGYENFDAKTAEKEIKFHQDELNRALEDFERIKSINEKNAQTIGEMHAKQYEVEAFMSDQARKLVLANEKSKADGIKSFNEEILDSDRNTLAQRIRAIKATRDAEISSLNANKSYVLGKPDAKNEDGSLTTESQTTILETQRGITDATRKAREDIDKETTNFYQRKIAALTEVNKNELNQQATHNEKIFKDEQQNLDERLVAFQKYVIQKQKIEDVEFSRDIQRGASKAGGKTSLTPEEQDKLISDRNTQKANEQANVEKQVYDIVFSSLQNQIKAVKDANDTNDKNNKEAYTKAINDENKLYADKKVSYEKYRRDIKEIQKKFNTEGFQEDIEDDKSDLQRLLLKRQEFESILKSSSGEVETAKVGVNVADAFGGDKESAQKDLDTATGKHKAAAKAINDIDKEVSKAKSKLDDDELKEANSNIVKKEKADYTWLQYEREIENELYRSIKSFADQSYEYRIDMVEKNKQLIDELYGYELSAIEKSSLSQKDKSALEIQLQAQKMVYDKNAQAEEKRIKIQQAQFDKKLSISHIIISTAEAIMAGIPPSPKSFTAAAVGAIELGTAIATPIPSFKDGVKNFEGGQARYGEDGIEIVKEPGKKPYVVYNETIGILPKGTDVVPIRDDVQILEKSQSDDWEKFIWLGKQIKKSSRQPKIQNNNFIKIDLGFDNYKRSILGS